MLYKKEETSLKPDKESQGLVVKLKKRERKKSEKLNMQKVWKSQAELGRGQNQSGQTWDNRGSLGI